MSEKSNEYFLTVPNVQKSVSKAESIYIVYAYNTVVIYLLISDLITVQKVSASEIFLDYDPDCLYRIAVLSLRCSSCRFK